MGIEGKLFLALWFLTVISHGEGDIVVNGDVPIGGTCVKDEDCEAFPDATVCDPVTKICFCRDDHEPVPPEGGSGPIICAPIRHQIGDPCLIADQCKHGTPGDLSDCLPSVDDPNVKICNCTDGNIHEPGEHKCHPIMGNVGDDCEVNAQCRFNLGDLSECANDECICSVRTAIPTPEMDRCLPIRDQLGLECELKEQCTLGLPGSWSDCLEQEGVKVCNCTEDAINEPNQHKCYPRRDHIGQICEVDAQCKINMGELSECLGDTNCGCLDDKAVENDARTFCLPIVDLIGGDCEEDQQCQAGEPGDDSVCIPSPEDVTKLVCNCSEDAIYQPGQHKCHPKAIKVEDQCVVEAQCTANLGDLSECVSSGSPGGDKVCRCERGAIARQNGTYCLPIRDELELECSEDQQCQEGVPGKDSVCLEGKCQCDSGATNEPGDHVCRRRAGLIGDSCQVNWQCKANLGDLSECLNGRECVCTPTFGVPNQHGNYCLPVVNTIGGLCLEQVQCLSGVPGQYSDCLVSTVLPGSTVCNCSSNALHQPGRHKCHKIADMIGETCEIQEQCRVKLGELTTCHATKGCQCIDDESIGNIAGDKCLPIIDKIGDRCDEDIQCTIGIPGEWSECRRTDGFPPDKVCTCKLEAVKDPNGEKCYKIASHVRDPCAIDVQCTTKIGPESECRPEGYCDCRTPYVPNMEGDPGSTCLPGGFLIGMPCLDMAQCVGDPGKTSVCTTAGGCYCMSGFTASVRRDDCLTVRNLIGEDCTEPQQCQQGDPGRLSDCMFPPGGALKGKCNCTREAINEAGQHHCYLKATQVGDPCEVGVQCVANLGYSHCLGGHCECLRNSTESSDNRQCLEKKYINEDCTDDAQCRHMDFTQCLPTVGDPSTSACQCISGYMEHPSVRNTCIKLATFIGESCSDHPYQCKSIGGLGATCFQGNQTCQCDVISEVVSSDRKSCLEAVPNLHGNCKETVQCQVLNSVCRNDSGGPGDNAKCVCQPNGFVEGTQAPIKCLQIRSQVGETCAEPIQCQTGIGDKATCELGFCRCIYPNQYFEDNCYTPSRLGGYCAVDQECRAGVNSNLTRCDNLSHQCVCVEDAWQDMNTCWITRRVGESCRNDAECKMSIWGPVSCVGQGQNKVCTCEDGYRSDLQGLGCSDAFSVYQNRTTLYYFCVLVSIAFGKLFTL